MGNAYLRCPQIHRRDLPSSFRQRKRHAGQRSAATGAVQIAVTKPQPTRAPLPTPNSEEPRVQGTSAAVETKFLSKPIIAEPGTASTESYVVAGLFDTEFEATNYASYLRTRFARFLVSLRKSTVDAPKHVYAFIPDLPLDEQWTDAKLYKRYALTQAEIAFIESQVAEHDTELFEGTVAGEVEDE